jgi:hypothetical protein
MIASLEHPALPAQVISKQSNRYINGRSAFSASTGNCHKGPQIIGDLV